MDFLVGSHFPHNPKLWSNTDTTKELQTTVIIPYTEKVTKEMKLPDSQKAIIVSDTFKGTKKNDLRALLEKHNIAEVVVPVNTTSFNQPLDVSVNRPWKYQEKR